MRRLRVLSLVAIAFPAMLLLALLIVITYSRGYVIRGEFSEALYVSGSKVLVEVKYRVISDSKLLEEVTRRLRDALRGASDSILELKPDSKALELLELGPGKVAILEVNISITNLGPGEVYIRGGDEMPCIAGNIIMELLGTKKYGFRDVDFSHPEIIPAEGDAVLCVRIASLALIQRDFRVGESVHNIYYFIIAEGERGYFEGNMKIHVGGICKVECRALELKRYIRFSW